MAQNQYDPYGSEQDLSYGDMIRESATAPLKPSSYLGLYTTLPTMWSTDKGVSLPFAGKYFAHGRFAKDRFKSAISETFRMASKKGFAGWAALAGKATLGIATMGLTSSGSGRILGTKALETRISRLQKVRAGYNKKRLDLLNKWINPKLGTAIKPKSLSGKRTIAKFKNLEKEIDILQKKSTLTKETIAGLTRRRTLLKWGLRAGKAVSIIGASMFAWDLISMVAEPAGRAAIRGLDNVMTQYQQRFMPELGGRMQMSYLSQGAATERQRAIQAISKSYINGRSAFGSEAQYMHQ